MMIDNETENMCEECGKEVSCETYFKEQHGFSVCESCIIEKFKKEEFLKEYSKGNG